jgi:hypothetical protein
MESQVPFSFFRCPTPHYREPIFAQDPATNPRRLPRPSRPILGGYAHSDRARPRVNFTQFIADGASIDIGLPARVLF